MGRNSLTQARLKELLEYNADSGLFAWRLSTSNRVVAGTQAGGLQRAGYVSMGVDGKKYMAHRLAWLYVTGSWPEADIDHINGNKADNRLANLRSVSRRINTHNTVKAKRNNRVKLLGVTAHGKRYRATITANRKSIHLGCFDTAEEASAAYKVAKLSIHEGAVSTRLGRV